jgi:hypothetical protein
VKRILFIIAFIALASRSFSQDYILFKSGEETAVIILTVADEYVRYYLFDDPARKMYAKDISAISKIRFHDGRELNYSETAVQDSRDNPPSPKTANRNPDQPPHQTGDSLFLKDGQINTVVVLEITPEIVKYRDFDNPAGPVYSIYKSKVAQIRLQNGKIETFPANGKR